MQRVTAGQQPPGLSTRAAEGRAGAGTPEDGQGQHTPPLPWPISGLGRPGPSPCARRDVGPCPHRPAGSVNHRASDSALSCPAGSRPPADSQGWARVPGRGLRRQEAPPRPGVRASALAIAQTGPPAQAPPHPHPAGPLPCASRCGQRPHLETLIRVTPQQGPARPGQAGAGGRICSGPHLGK